MRTPMFKRIREDIDAVLARDPAARSRIEVLLFYPGLHALLVHRLAHRLWLAGWRLSARGLSSGASPARLLFIPDIARPRVASRPAAS